MKTNHAPRNNLAGRLCPSSLSLASAVMMLVLVEMRLAHAAGTIQVEFPQYWAREATAFVVVGVVRGPNADMAATVDFTTVAQTATAGADYTETQGTLTFAVREKLKLITIPILNDGIRESDERFQLKLSNATGDVLGARITATVAITDNDPGVGFASSQLWVHEDQRSIELKVLRGNDQSLGTFTVDYTLIDLTAQLRVDYAPEEPGLSYEPDGTISRIGRIELAEGEMSRSIWVHVVNDHVLEPDERFQVRLSNPSAGMSVGSASTATITIVDATGMEPRRFNAIRMLEDGSIHVESTASVSQRFRPFYSIFQMEVSADLKNWERLQLLAHANNSTKPPTFPAANSQANGSRFYRQIAAPLIAPDLPPSGPYPVGITKRIFADPDRRNRYRISTNGTFAATIWYPAIPVPGRFPQAYYHYEKRALENLETTVIPAWRDRIIRLSSYSTPDLPVARSSAGEWPVAVYSHGGGVFLVDGQPVGQSLVAVGHRVQGQSLGQNLASHGYVVVAPDHFDAGMVVHENGDLYLTPNNPASLFTVDGLEDRVKDLVLMLNELDKLNKEDLLLRASLNLNAVAAIGFSWGALSAGELCQGIAAVRPPSAWNGAPRPHRLPRTWSGWDCKSLRS